MATELVRLRLGLAAAKAMAAMGLRQEIFRTHLLPGSTPGYGQVSFFTLSLCESSNPSKSGKKLLIRPAILKRKAIHGKPILMDWD